MNEEYKVLLDRYASALPERSRTHYSGYFRDYLEWCYRRKALPTGQTIRDWMEVLRRKGYADGTLRKAWGILRRAHVINEIEWPFRRGEAPVVREQQVWKPALDPLDIRQMIRTVRGLEDPVVLQPLNPRHAACLCLATVWGCRRVEIEQMIPEFIDLRSGTIFIETAKQGRQRYHVLPEDLGGILDRWGFRQRMSVSYISDIFSDLKVSIGLVMSAGHELGWHGIRRAAVKEAFRAGFDLGEVHAYYRWKRTGSNMPLVYAGSPTVGRGGVTTDVNETDRQLDLEFYDRHSFVRYWREP